jgi:hypothetical protein
MPDNDIQLYRPETVYDNLVFQTLDWENLIDVAMVAREWHDKSRWILGDVAKEVVRRWGYEMLEDFAHAVEVQRETLLRYVDVATKFPKEEREKYPRLSWSHFRSLSAKEKGVQQKLLEEADNNTWSVEQLGVETKKFLNDPDRVIKPQIRKCSHCGKYYVVNPEDANWCNTEEHHPKREKKSAPVQ